MSDTHVPTRARDLPSELWAAVESADLVIHAGDWMAVSLLDALTERSAQLLACWGNNDGPALRERLPEVATGEIEGVRIVVTHETGGAAGRDARMSRRHADYDLLVFGHSHIPWDSTAPGGLRLLNPGSPTDRRRQPSGTFSTFAIRDGGVHDVVLRAVAPAPAGSPRRSPG